MCVLVESNCAVKQPNVLWELHTNTIRIRYFVLQYSTHPSYKNYFFDIVGKSPKSDASAIFYPSNENYIQSDHYYDLKNCMKLVSPLGSIQESKFSKAVTEI